jgi:NAD(P)-dependent dehydrogenase (short-subunit alcohol dehydrogenase family)
MAVSDRGRGRPVFPLEGRVALVTGVASSFIGQATAERLSRDGATVIVTDIQERRTFEAVEAIVGATQGRVIGRIVDVTDRGAVDRLVGESELEWGPIDVLINNAALNSLALLGDLSPESWDRVVAVNLTAPWYLIRSVLPGMIGQGRGAIVNLSSVSSWLADEGYGVYAATKMALRALTATVAREYGPHGIRCNAVAPGIIRSKFVDQRPEQFAGEPAMTPLRRLGEPEDVADVIAFLVSDEARFVTGVTVDVTGGRYLRP